MSRVEQGVLLDQTQLSQLELFIIFPMILVVT